MELRVLQTLLNPVIAKWHSFGLQLGVSPDVLNQFERPAAACYVRDYLREVLERWLSKNPNPPPKIQDIITVLGGPTLRNNALAQALETEYQGNHQY